MGREMGWRQSRRCAAARRMIDIWLAGGLRWRLQRVALARHLWRCPGCRAYAAAVRRVPRFVRQCLPVQPRPELAEQIKATCVAEMYAAACAGQTKPRRRAVGLAAGALAAACLLAVVLARPPHRPGVASEPATAAHIERVAEAPTAAEAKLQPAARASRPVAQERTQRVRLARATPSRAARAGRQRAAHRSDDAPQWWEVMPAATVAAPPQSPAGGRRDGPAPQNRREDAATAAAEEAAEQAAPEPLGLEPDWPEDTGLDEMMVAEEASEPEPSGEAEGGEELAPAVAPQLVAGVLASAVVEHYLASAVAEEGARLALASISAPAGKGAGDAQASGDSTGGSAGN